MDFDTIYDVPRFFAADMTDNCRVLLFGYELCFGDVIYLIYISYTYTTHRDKRLLATFILIIFHHYLVHFSEGARLWSVSQHLCGTGIMLASA